MPKSSAPTWVRTCSRRIRTGRWRMPALLEIRGLHAAYGSVRVLDGIDMDLAEGRVTALLGANGAGKTTTLRAICRHLVDTRGEVDRKSTRLNSSHLVISYAVFCLKKKKEHVLDDVNYSNAGLCVARC